MSFEQSETAFFEHKDSLKLVPSWQQQMELIGHLCQYSQNILAVIGQPGTGKTSFAQLLNEYKLSGIRKVLVRAQDIEDSAALMEKIASGFHLPWSSLSDEQTIPDGIKHDQRAQVWTLIIDDADKLPSNVLCDLFRLVDFNKSPRQQLRIVLTGEEALEKALLSEDIEEIICDRIHAIELGAWNQDDIRSILDEDLSDNDDFVRKVDLLSKGVPSKVLQISAMSPQTLLQSESVFGQWLDKVLDRPVFMGVTLGVLVGAAFMAYSYSHKPAAVPEIAKTEKKTFELPKMVQNTNGAAATEGEQKATHSPRFDFKPINQRVQTSQEVPKAQHQQVVAHTEDKSVNFEALKNSFDAPEEPTSTDLAPSSEPVAANSEQAPKLVEKASANQSLNQKISERVAQKVMESQAIESKSEAVKKVTPVAQASKTEPDVMVKNEVIENPQTSKTPTPEAPIAIAATPKPAKVQAPTPEPKEAKAPKAQPKVAKAAKPALKPSQKTQQAKKVAAQLKRPATRTMVLSDDEQHIMSEKPKAYTLQLVGASKVENIQNFIKGNQLNGQAKIARSQVSGKNWFIVIYGTYNSYQEAEKAAQTLTQEKNLKPWVRPYSSLQSDILARDQKS